MTGNELQQQGVTYFGQKDYDEALRAFEGAHAAYETEGNPELAAEMQVNLGLVKRAQGANDEALSLMREGLTVFQNANDTRRTAMVLGNMGGVYAAMGDKELAYNCYREAADIFQELGEKKLQGETLMAMANLQMKDGKVAQSAATYEAGLSQIENLNTSQKLLKGLIGIRNRLTGGSSHATS